MISANITVYGAGYVGLVTGACLAKSGHHVLVLDIDRDKLASLRDGHTPFFEPGLDEILQAAIADGRLSFAHPDDDHEPLGPGGFVYVAVGTPASSAGFADLRYVRAVIDVLDQNAVADATVIMKSTVPPGTGEPIAERLSRHGIGYVSNPEFLREGNAVDDWFHTDRIVLGGDRKDVDKVVALYEDIDAPIVRSGITSAELVKYASNAFLATKISFVNEIASICEVTGANIVTVAKAIGMDSRIGSAFLHAGIGYGGSCFPKDTRALDFLATVNGYEFHLIKSVIEVNARQRLLPAMGLKRHLGTLQGKKVALLGLTFKPDTDDTREAPAAEIIELLLSEGAIVRAHDPIGKTHREDPHYSQVATLEEAVEDADGVVVATEWPQYSGADWRALAPSMATDAIVFDGRNCLDPEAVRAAGLTYRGIGRH